MDEPLTLDALNALPADELARRLSGPDRVATIRAAAEGGVAEAQVLYAQMLLDGDGVVRDEREAVGWFWKAAQKRHVMAINMVGRCYDLGWGVAIDKALAAKWYGVAANLGFDWAMYNLATLMTLGEGVPKDRPGAFALFRKAAELGGPARAKALNFIGSFHEDGWVVERDVDEAARFYAIAAQEGDFRGMFNHARMLFAVGRDAEADRWIEKSLSLGNPRFCAQVDNWLSVQRRS